MSWFDDQIAYSKLKDDEALSESYANIVGAIVGRKIQQAWQDESRAAKDALEDICKYYRLRPTEIPESVKDLNAQLDYALQPCSIMRRSVKLKPGWHRDAIGAMLGVRRDNGVVTALIPRKMGGYAYRDPQTGRMIRITAKNESMFDEEAIVFYRPFPLRPLNLRDLIEYMRTSLDFVDFFWYFLSLLAVTLLGLLMPKLTNILFSDVVASGSRQLLIAVIVFMVCQMIASQLVSGISSLLLNRIGIKLSLSVESASMMRLFSMPVEFFRNYTAGELNQHVQYLNQVCSSLVSTVFSTGMTGVFSLVYITQIFRYSPALVVPALLMTTATLVWGIVSVLIKIKISKKSMEIGAKERGMVYSIIAGIQKIRLCGAEKRAFARWGNLYAEEARLLYSPPKLFLLSDVISMGIGLVGTIVLYYEAVRSGVSVADYYSFSAAYAYISGAFASIVSIAQTIANIRPVLQIVKPILDAQPEIEEQKEVVTRLAGGIELNRIFFKYPGTDRMILEDISFKIRPGQYVAIVGESGCGKSTLMRVLLGFEKPQKGAVYYDGKNIDKLDLKSLRRKIGVVMQNGRLFWGDIFSNITICAPWLGLDDAWAAAEIAGIADDIRAMPMGMNTIIQEGTGGISGGQRQRIMIARAVAPKPKIVFLDEATSALDNITQKRVSEAMDAMRCTRVVIAHRLSTIRQCDRILFLKDGKVAEDGTYDELIEKNGLFADLVRRQMVTSE